jgi:hypothetical protein
MRTGDFKLWRSPVVCWALSVFFLVLAGVWFVVGSQAPNKSHPEGQRYLLAFAGVSASVAVLFFVLGLRAIRKREHNVVP